MTQTGPESRPNASIDLAETADGVRIAIRTLPRARRNGISGVRDGRLVVRVTAPPVGGAANEAVVRELSRSLSVPTSALRVVAGERARNKVVEVAGLSRSDVMARLA
jgi:uncharacterized protein (TIGR00251 family)